MTDDASISMERALAMLPPGDTVHVIVPVGGIVGADWDRAAVEEMIRTHGAELAGPVAQSLGHGMVCFAGPRTGLYAHFIQTV